MMTLGALTALVYIALAASIFSIGMLLVMVAIDFKRGNLW